MAASAVTSPPFPSYRTTEQALFYEENFPTQRAQAQTRTRFPGAHGHERRSQSSQRAPCQGPGTPERLSPTPIKFVFPRTRRVRKSSEFRELVRVGRKSQDRLFSVYALANGFDHGRLGITVSRRVSARAVDRNRIKRLIREAYRHEPVRLCGVDLVVIARPAALEAEVPEMLQSLRNHWSALQKACKP